MGIAISLIDSWQIMQLVSEFMSRDDFLERYIFSHIISAFHMLFVSLDEMKFFLSGNREYKG